MYRFVKRIILYGLTKPLTARQANILSITSLRSLELENEKTGKEEEGFHRNSKNQDVRDKHRKPVSANTMSMKTINHIRQLMGNC